MRINRSIVALALLGLAVPFRASAYVVVRAGVHVRPVAVVAVAPVSCAPPPTTVVVTQPAPQPVAPPLATQLPLATTMWTLRSGCNKVSAADQTYYVCGPNWLKAYPGVNGSPSCYGVVALPGRVGPAPPRL